MPQQSNNDPEAIKRKEGFWVSVCVFEYGMCVCGHLKDNGVSPLAVEVCYTEGPTWLAGMWRTPRHMHKYAQTQSRN